MKIGYIVQVYESVAEPTELIKMYYSTRFTIKELAQRAEVFVFYRFYRDVVVDFEGATYYFIRDELPPMLRHWHVARTFANRVSDILSNLSLDIIHAHSQNAALFHFNLRRKVKSIPYIVQDHGAPKSISYVYLKKLLLNKVDALLMSAEGMEVEWVKYGIFLKKQCYFVMEASSEFGDVEMIEQIERTSDFVLLWVGNLDGNKDPLTLLKAFKQFVVKQEHARLNMIFKHTDLLSEVQKIIDEDPVLTASVNLIGYVERRLMVNYYNSSDIMISTSYKEGSGYAVIEAMSCGLTPILTAIPSFIELTKNAKIGALFTPGNAEELSVRMLEVYESKKYLHRNMVKLFFENNFSYSSIANDLIGVYQEVISK